MDELIANMERFGRYTFKPLGQHDDPNEIWHHLIGPLLPIAQADPDAFVTRLNRAVASTEGWAVYGAAHAIIELLGGDFRHPAAGELMHRSLQFLRSRAYLNCTSPGTSANSGPGITAALSHGSSVGRARRCRRRRSPNRRSVNNVY
ncbi:hypothetical protein ACWEOS_02665 [Micromonospora taraxaci]